jgi:hypothetical protein
VDVKSTLHGLLCVYSRMFAACMKVRSERGKLSDHQTTDDYHIVDAPAYAACVCWARYTGGKPMGGTTLCVGTSRPDRGRHLQIYVPYSLTDSRVSAVTAAAACWISNPSNTDACSNEQCCAPMTTTVQKPQALLSVHALPHGLLPGNRQFLVQAALTQIDDETVLSIDSQQLIG